MTRVLGNEATHGVHRGKGLSQEVHNEQPRDLQPGPLLGEVEFLASDLSLKTLEPPVSRQENRRRRCESTDQDDELQDIRVDHGAHSSHRGIEDGDGRADDKRPSVFNSQKCLGNLPHGDHLSRQPSCEEDQGVEDRQSAGRWSELAAKEVSHRKQVQPA